MKKADMWMPLYFGDYLSDTMHLTRAQHGSYLLLLMAMWKSGGSLENDPEQLATAARMTAAEWAAESRIIMRFFSVDDGRVTQKRLVKELLKCHENRRRASQFWRSLSFETRAELRSKRKLAEYNSTPSWLTEDHIREIEAIYEVARTRSAETGIPHEVDHIVPLQGRNVCGLNVPWNLRAIPAAENRAKGRFH